MATETGSREYRPSPFRLRRRVDAVPHRSWRLRADPRYAEPEAACGDEGGDPHASIGHRIAVAPRIGAGKPVAGRRVDHHRRRTAADAVLTDGLHLMPAQLQLVDDRGRNRRLDVHPVEAGIVRPHRSIEMHRLHAWPREGGMEVWIPVVPELDDIEERLQDRLLLVVAAGSADRHERLAVLENQARRQRVARPRPRT